ALLAGLAEAVTGTCPTTFEDPVEALLYCQTNEHDLVLIDFTRPNLNGHDFIRMFKRIPACADVPIIMITADDEKEIRKEALSVGATEFLAKPVDFSEFQLRVRNLLKLREAQNMLKDNAKLLQHEIDKAIQMVSQRERELIVRLTTAAEFRDPETGSHILRMSHYSELIARQLGMSYAFQKDILEAAPMHDIGKLGTPDYILLKPGKLDEHEMSIMKRHAEIGAHILQGSTSPLLRLAEEIALSHHEKFDGTGYPKALAGEAIPLSGRIIAVADVFDALTSERPYKKAWSVADARSYINDGVGKHFCPACVAAFNSAWDDVLAIMNRFPDHQPEALLAEV
ncbi:MAG: HD-GYP domain-containing protein, partial [Burkholderiaceae bacterium]